MSMRKKKMTPFGEATENKQGYYRLKGGELLHRKIWEEYYGQKIPPGYIIHHKDENPKNNAISNLQLMTAEDHIKHHHRGKQVDTGAREAISKATNQTGYYRVSKKACKKCKKGFVYRYQWYNKEHKKLAITSTDLQKLKNKVKREGLVWKRIK